MQTHTVTLDRRAVQQVQWASALDALAGLWLFASVWALAIAPPLSTSNLICGAVVFVLAAIRALGAHRAPGLSWFNMLIGLWVLLSPFVLMPTFAHGEWTTFATGVAIVVLASWSAIAGGNRYHLRDRPFTSYEDLMPPPSPL